jgi:hypothetical protein
MVTKGKLLTERHSMELFVIILIREIQERQIRKPYHKRSAGCVAVKATYKLSVEELRK